MERQNVCGIGELNYIIGELNYIITFSLVKIIQINIEETFLERDYALNVLLSYGKLQSVQHSVTYCTATLTQIIQINSIQTS
jgi:hypothetical protein